MQMRASIENYDIVKIPKIPKEMPTVALSPQACLMCLMAADNCGASPPPLQSGGRLVEQNLSNADLSFSHSKFPLEISKKKWPSCCQGTSRSCGLGPFKQCVGLQEQEGRALHAVCRTISIERNYRVFQDKMENNLFLLGSVLFPFLYHLILRR